MLVDIARDTFVSRYDTCARSTRCRVNILSAYSALTHSIIFLPKKVHTEKNELGSLRARERDELEHKLRSIQSELEALKAERRGVRSGACTCCAVFRFVFIENSARRGLCRLGSCGEGGKEGKFHNLPRKGITIDWSR